MTNHESDSSYLSSPEINQEDELEITENKRSLAKAEPDKKQGSGQSSLKTNILPKIKEIYSGFSSNSSIQVLMIPRILLFTGLSMAITLISIVINNSWLGILGTLATLLLSVLILYPWWQDIIQQWFAPEDRKVFVGL
ncbi:MAG: hypothetical protein AN487_22810, partial [Anabaena sp. CRKS33]